MGNANIPAAQLVVQIEGGSPQMNSLVGGANLGGQDGSNLGTGGPTAALPESTAAAGNFASNRAVEFLDDRYAQVGDPTGATNSSGVYKKNQGGAGLYGLVSMNGEYPLSGGRMSGLFVLHPNGVPTLCFLANTQVGLTAWSTVDGTTGANWVSTGVNAEAAAVIPTTGQAIAFKSSIVWAHRSFTGAAGTGGISQYDFATGLLTRYAFGNANAQACSVSLHVHGGLLFVAGSQWGLTAGERAGVAKLAGSFVGVADAANNGGIGQQITAASLGHSAMFTDPATGDLIVVWTGKEAQGVVRPRAAVTRIQNATGAASASDITDAVLGAVEAADKYKFGGGSESNDRRWSVFVDTITDPTAPRTYLTTWIPGGNTECWDWKGVAAEVAAVGLLAGISDNFALPYNSVGGGHRSPRSYAAEMDPSLFAEVPGGTRVFFRGRGSGFTGTITFRGTDSQGAPSTVIPILGGLTVESGAPSTTPAQTGDTITNFTPDDGTTLYSVRLDTGAVGVGIDAGEVGLIIPDMT